jgi:hypothetical protein
MRPPRIPLASPRIGCARAHFTPEQLSKTVQDYLERGPAFHYPGEAGRASAVYEFPEGILCVVSQGHQLTVCTPEDVGFEHAR